MHAVKATEAVLFGVKMFLSIRRCGTAYSYGMNSYALFWVVVAWVKLEMPKKKPVVSFSDYDSLTTALGGLFMSSKTQGVDLMSSC